VVFFVVAVRNIIGVLRNNTEDYPLFLRRVGENTLVYKILPSYFINCDLDNALESSSLN
jgi:hypothetical protein